MSSTVTTTHPEYDLALPLWRLVGDAAEGQDAIKAGTTRYLPQFVPPDEDRYRAYLQRAYFLGVTGRTRDALVGMAFRKSPETEGVPDSLEFALEDADGSGQSLVQLAKQGLGNGLEKGRHIYLVDYPETPEGIDAETEARLGLRPLIASYTAESLINWKAAVEGGRFLLTLAVLHEERDTSEDEFTHECENVYRVLRLREGVYTQTLYNDQGQVIVDEYAPRMAGGGTFDHIPLYIVGSQNNRPDVDEAPLYDLAVVNIAHYRNTADLEEAGYVVGQPTLHFDIGEMDQQTFDAYNKNGINFGSRTGVISQKGKLELVQAEDRTILLKLKEEKQQEMVAIGARLVQNGGQVETAEAARINAAAESSTLDNLVSNLSEALQDCLRDCARFVGVDPESVTFELNKEFWDGALDAQAAMAVIQFGDAGIIARSDQRDMLRSGRLELRDGRSDDDIDAEISTQGP